MITFTRFRMACAGAAVLLMMQAVAFAQKPLGNFVVITPGESPEEIIRKAANVTPSRLQYEWQKLEVTGFIHFGKNTFTNREWGTRDSTIHQFNPTALDAAQWVRTFKDAGIKLMILVAKHHDGLCMWPSKYTTMTIAHTPYKNGTGDLVKEVADACRKAGLKFGVYLSPWDMNEQTYGSDAYNEHFRNQLTELLTNYGDVAEVWFDGACGEGPNGKKQVYDWNSYYALIRRLQPNAVIAVTGPDVRWVGTESGYGRKSEWSVLPGVATNADDIAAHSQQTNVNGAFVPGSLMDEDLGSRKIITKASSLIWYPAETDVSIRPGWFYHEAEDDLVATPAKLVDIYFNSVGLNGVLLLNVPPDKRGLIHENDIASLRGMRYILDETFRTNLASDAAARATEEQKGREAKHILDGDSETYWTPGEARTGGTLEVRLKRPRTFNTLMLQENILVGQRVEKFHCDYSNGGAWKPLVEGTTIGYKRLFRFPEVTAASVRITIDESRTNPTLASFGIYMAPPQASIESAGSSFGGSTEVRLATDQKQAKLYYALDGRTPNARSTPYTRPIRLERSTTVAAIAIGAGGRKGVPVRTRFNKARYAYELKTEHNKAYPGSGMYTLVDGVLGAKNFKDGRWMGFDGRDVEAVIDLGAVKEIHTLSARFLQDVGAGIFLPASVEYALSDDGAAFGRAHVVTNTVPVDEKEIVVHPFTQTMTNTAARYVRVRAKNMGACPAWSISPGAPSWLFADEFIIE